MSEVTGKKSRMITVTEAAKERIRAIVAAVGSDGEVLRLDRVPATTANGGAPKLALCVGEPEERDEPIRHRGKTLLWVSIAVSAGFDGCVVDVLEMHDGTGFAIGPPEAGRDAR